MRRCPTLIDLPVHQIQEQRVEVQRVIHNQEVMQQHKVEYEVSNSSEEEFERLRSQERIAECLIREAIFKCTSEDSNTQVQHMIMNSQKVPQVVEVPK